MYFGREQMTTCTLASSATVPVENVTLAIASIANIGAKNILVANIPDLGQLPATRNSVNSARLSALTGTHNQSLKRALLVIDAAISPSPGRDARCQHALL